MARPTKALSEPIPHVPPLSPQDALKSFKILDGFRMELLASEPQVASPVAMCYDENGRAYVCEMRDYPYTDKKAHKAGQENPTDQPIGRVRLLEDTDGDGKFDRSVIFATDLSWPTGVTPWKGGVFVAATPDIWYFKDTNGDGVADIRIKAFTGFRKLNVQATMNSLIWGLDNKIYGAGSSNGGQIRPGDKPDAKPVFIARNDYRLDPVTGGFEAISGGARFGNTFDDWGNRFLCNIRNPAQHVVLPSHYLARNPSLPVRSPVNDIAPFGDALPVYRTSPVEPWRDIRAKRWSGERDINMPRSELVGAGVVTSSSGITVYRGAAYPAKYYGNLFLGEVAGNLFYRQVLTPHGVSFTATRPETNVEFLTSTDIWFRPVNFVNAPDGTLHVMDMYREVIEHPWSIPDDIREQLDLENGRDHGRLYRLAPPNFTTPKPPRLGSASTAQLVATLENPNSWWRETAQRLLFEQRDAAATPLLQQLCAQSRNELARLHALHLLASFEGLTEEILVRALKDTSAGVREHAVKLSEPWLERSAAIRNEVIARAKDESIRVGFQTAFTLGEIKNSDTADALLALAKRFGTDAWVRTAILSSASQSSGPLLATAVQDRGFAASDAGLEFTRQLAQLVAAKNLTNDIARTLTQLPDEASVQATVLLGFGEGIKRSGRTVRKLAAADTAVGKRIAGILESARTMALDDTASLLRRQAAVQLLAHDDFDQIKSTMIALLDAKQPQEIQRAAVSALAALPQPDIAAILLTPWRTYTPALRSEVIQAMLGVKNRLLPLFDAIDEGRITANQIPPLRRGLLLKHVDKAIAARAEKLFGENAGGSRKEVVEKYRAALTLKGSKASGQKVYETACMTCHRAGMQGNDVGPNLATIRQWNPEQALVNILDPNREVAPSFVEYVVDLKDGQTISGLIADETASSISLKRADNFQQTILRSNIDKISGSGLSLMPEGLEATITVQQMADLLAFLLEGDGR